MVPVGVAQVGWVKVTLGADGAVGTALIVKLDCGDEHDDPLGRTVM